MLCKRLGSFKQLVSGQLLKQLPLSTKLRQLSGTPGSGILPVHQLKVDCYFDTISPYSWPAFEVLTRYRNRWDLEINWRPIFMAGLTHEAGNKFLESMTGCPNKAIYMFNDLESRIGRFFDIPLRIKSDPIEHIGVVGSLSQQRYVTAVHQNCPEKLEEVCRQIWIRTWGEEDGTSHREEDLILISKRAGLSASEIADCLKSMKDPVIKEKLKEVTSEAVEKGVFGVPTMFFHKQGGKEEMIWGSDRFDMVGYLFGKEWEGPNPK